MRGQVSLGRDAVDAGLAGMGVAVEPEVVGTVPFTGKDRIGAGKAAVNAGGHGLRADSDAPEAVLENRNADEMLTLTGHPRRVLIFRKPVADPDVTAMLLIDLSHHTAKDPAVGGRVPELLEGYETMDHLVKNNILNLTLREIESRAQPHFHFTGGGEEYPALPEPHHTQI